MQDYAGLCRIRQDYPSVVPVECGILPMGRPVLLLLPLLLLMMIVRCVG
jgi:hypothetical protein